MAYVPTPIKSNVAEDVLNYVIQNANIELNNKIPYYSADSDNLREIGAIIMDSPNTQNHFINAINRIARVQVASKLYENPLAMFKKGILEVGDTIEDIFVRMAKASCYNPAEAEDKVFKREKPETLTAYYSTNYRARYKVTVEEEELGMAFNSLQGVADLIMRITEQLYTAAAYDEQNAMLYVLARKVLDGSIPQKAVSDWNTPSGFMPNVRGVAQDMQFMSDKYNIAGVKTATKIGEQYVLIDAFTSGLIDYTALAPAFHMEKADFMSRVVTMPKMSDVDTDRLYEICGTAITEFTEAEKTALDNVKIIVLDGAFFQMWDKLLTMRAIYNSEGLYTNYNLHDWKVVAVSPFAGCIMFNGNTPAISTVVMSQGTMTLTAGNEKQLNVDVTADPTANVRVRWESNHPEFATVDPTGKVTAVAAGQAVITATSLANSAKKATCTVTVS